MEEKAEYTTEGEMNIKSLYHSCMNAYYGAQKRRIAMSNAIRVFVLQYKGILPTRRVPDKKDKDKKAYGKYNDKWVQEEFMKIVDAANDVDREALLRFYGIYDKTLNIERDCKLFALYILEKQPIYSKWLTHVRGIGPVLSLNLVHRLGHCERFSTVSKLWKYAGMHVVNGEAPRRKKGEKLNFNKEVRVMMFKVMDCFIKQRSTPYREIYDTEKQIQLEMMEKKTKGAPESKMHAELRARRYAGKIFLTHYWMCARHLIGEPLPAPYSVRVLNHTDILPPPEWHRVFGSSPPWEEWGATAISVKEFTEQRKRQKLGA